MRLVYRVKTFFTYDIKWIKWWYQRAKRGYADCDVWSLDWYLNSFMPRVLRQLKEETHGYPAGLADIETWQRILEDIALGFDACQRLINADNWEMNHGSEMKLIGNRVEFTHPWTKEQIAQFKILDKKDNGIFKRGMKLFIKYYMSLWD